MEQIVEYFGVVTGLLYLLLEIKQHRAMWVVGFVTSLTYVFVFFSSKIYADMGLNIYYVVISLYGFRKWTQRVKPITPEETASNEAILFKHITLRLFIGIILTLLCIWGGIYYLLYTLTDSPIPLGDAFTTATGIVATWMLARRIIEHWMFWVVVNSVSVWLFYQRGLYPTMFLYLCYAILAIAGYYNWKKKGIKTDDNTL